MNIALWIVQVLLAALFVFAGGMKLAMPIAELTKETGMSAGFIRFISIAEVLGGLGLLLPSLLRIKTGLTPLAAAGLIVIMVGAVAMSLKQGVVVALIPFVTLLALAFVAYGRSRLVPLR